MPALAGVLERHKQHRDAWGVGVLLVTRVGEGGGAYVGELITVVGPMIGMAAIGETLELEGEPEATRYGPQFRITRQASLGIATTSHASRWLERLDGIGPKLARAIEQTMGDSILAVLGAPPAVGEPDRLTDVPGIGEDRARLIRDSWEGVGASGSLEDLRYLDGLGCSRWEVQQILKEAKARRLAPRALLELQPYTLQEAHGLGFLKVDAIARRAGCSPLSPARIEAGIAHVASERIDGDGHTRLLYGQLVSEAAALLCVPPTLILRGCNALKVRGVLVVDATVRPLTVTLTALREAAAVVLAAVARGGSLGALPNQVDVRARERTANVDECRAAQGDGVAKAIATPSPAVIDINGLIDQLCDADPQGGAPWAWE